MLYRTHLPTRTHGSCPERVSWKRSRSEIARRSAVSSGVSRRTPSTGVLSGDCGEVEAFHSLMRSAATSRTTFLSNWLNADVSSWVIRQFLQEWPMLLHRDADEKA